eukprot:scaffold1930_cov112-Isochrysis_galbana.AAC.1
MSISAYASDLSAASLSHSFVPIHEHEFTGRLTLEAIRNKFTIGQLYDASIDCPHPRWNKLEPERVVGTHVQRDNWICVPEQFSAPWEHARVSFL